MTKPLFSVVTPTYNRANLIARVFDSLQSQTLTDFEWIVIDDGSTDDTELVVSKMKNQAKFNVKYVKTINQGKAKALNESLRHCNGVMYLVFDSDDWCDSNALEVFNEEYKKLKGLSVFNEYCSISCLKRYASGDVVGDDYKKISKYGDCYIGRLNKNIKGDKWECLFLDKLIGRYYPVVNNEKYMAPSYLWLQLAGEGYKTVFLNEVLSTIEYQADGISSNNLRHRYQSSKSTCIYYKDSFLLSKLNCRVRSRFYINYIRFSKGAGLAVKFNVLFFHLYFLGLILYRLDAFKLRKSPAF